MYTIYKIVNPLGECYVGMTSEPLNIRFSKHCSEMARYPERRICQSLIEHGPENHKISAIEFMKSKRRAKVREGHYINLIGTLNTRIGLNVKFTVSELKGEYDRIIA